ncbi:MAG: N-acetylmuramoyl-L-alanine amidase [Acetobacteraceae bacterium]|nr:N-acetylmuramoyl-L-alanine amidase [Acetobacteraceae bacterium]
MLFRRVVAMLRRGGAWPRPGPVVLVVLRAGLWGWLLPALLLGLFVAAALGLSRAWRALPTGPAPGALAGRVVVIDPGHGGEDPGALGGSGAVEKEVCLSVSLRLRDLLERAGARALLTRSGDYDLSGPLAGDLEARVRADLEARMVFIASSGAHALVSVHANAFPSPVWYGAQAFYSPRGGSASRRLALLLQEELARFTRTDREASSRIRQYVLDRAPMPAATVELGFLSHPGEERLLQDPDYQQRLAWAVFLGLARFFASPPELVPSTPEPPTAGL